MAGNPKAQIEITASSSRLKASLDSARAKFKEFGAGVNKSMMGGKKSLGDMAASGAGHMLGNYATRGLDALVDSGKQVIDFERALTRMGITANATPEKLNAMRAEIRNISRDTGLSAERVLGASQAYIDLTGDVDGAMTATKSFSRIAQASGADINDVTTAAASLADALKIKPSEMEATFSGLINQGKQGAVSLKDFAGEITALAPKFARFKGALGVDGGLQLGAAFQVARKGFGNASEAATGLESLMQSLIRHASTFEHAGVRMFDKHKDGTKTLRNLHEIVAAIGNSSLAKDPTKLTKAFGRVEAEATFNQLRRLAPMYDQMIEAGKDSNTVNRDLATYMESSAGRIDAAWNRFKETLASVFNPARIETFAAALEKTVSLVDRGMRAPKFIGEAAAKLLGGESFDDQVKSTQDARYRERVAFYQKRDGVDENRARVAVASEDLFAQQLREGKKSDGTAYSFAELKAIKRHINDADFSDAGALRSYVDNAANNSDPWAATRRTPLNQQPQDQYAGFTADQRKKMEAIDYDKMTKAFADALLKLNIKIDGNTVAKAVTSAPIHAARPGGRHG